MANKYKYERQKTSRGLDGKPKVKRTTKEKAKILYRKGQTVGIKGKQKVVELHGKYNTPANRKKVIKFLDDLTAPKKK